MSTALELGRSLLDRSGPEVEGVWSRATAHLARQDLEAELRVFWQRFAPGVEKASIRAQLLCLPFYLHRDPELARSVGWVHGRLSEACHQHPYDLAPTSEELARWVQAVGSFALVVGDLTD